MIGAILKKELKSYFNSPVAYIILVVFLGLGGWFFAQNLFIVGQANISGFIHIVPVLFLLLIPGLCMRLVAEERARGTIEVLSTLPLKDYEIVVGKWLAAFVLLLLGLCATLIYPATITILGKPDFGVVFCSYLGITLLALLYTSIGIFASSITSSQIVAFVIGIFICFLFFIIGKVLTVLPIPLVSVFNYLSVDHHLNSIIRGVIDSRDLIFFFSLTFLFVFGAIYFVGRLKEKVINAVYTILTIIIIILINIIGSMAFTRIDLTYGHIYSLTPATKKFICNLEDNVVIRAYITDKLPFPYNNRAKYVTDLLYEYRQQSRGKIRLERISPKSREEVMQAQRSGIYPLRFTEVRQGEFGVKQGFMGLVFLFGDKKERIPVIEDLANLEYDITSRIKKLIQPGQKTIGFTTGHKEVELSDEVKHEINKRYLINEINLKDTLPISCNALVILGPKNDFDTTETKKLKEYIENKGPVGFFIDRFNINLDFFIAFLLKLDNLDALLKEYKINLEPGFIMDKSNEVMVIRTQRGIFSMQNLIPYPYFPKLFDLSRENPITKDFDEIVLPFVSPVSGGIELARTSKLSWLRKKPQSLNPFDKQKFLPVALPFDDKGPFNTISCVTGDKRLCIVGTSRIVDKRFINPAGLALFMNILDWLTQDEELISIRSKVVKERPIKNIPSHLKTLIRWLNTILPGVIFIIIGLLRWRHRRKERTRYEI